MFVPQRDTSYNLFLNLLNADDDRRKENVKYRKMGETCVTRFSRSLS